MGPTASGKTELAAALFESGRYELISVDAVQVYRGFDIGSAKPPASWLARYPHHLIDCCDPGEVYSAARFCKDAARLCEAIHARGKCPLLAGGSMFYFHALEHGLSPLPATPPDLRERISARMQQQGSHQLHQVLEQIDPATRRAPTDRQRIQRDLEIAALSGNRPSKLRGKRTPPLRCMQLIKIALFHADRAAVHQRIAERFEQMLGAGLIEETRALLQTAPADSLALNSVGYRQVAAYLAGQGDYADMREQAVIATRQLLKRQLTWLRQQTDVVWWDAHFPPALLHDYLDRRLCRKGEGWQ